MTTYTDYCDDTTGNTLYAKPEPLVASPWGTDKVTGTETGSTGSYAFTLDSASQYVVYRQLGGSAASTDLKLGRFSKNLLLDVKAKTDLIGTGTVGNISFTAADGTIGEVVIGDDYLDANGRAFQWDIDPVTGLTLGSITCWFGASRDGKSLWLVEGTATLVSGKWRLKFDLPKTETEGLQPGPAEWSVAVHQAAVEITRVKPSSSLLELVEKST